MKPKKIEKTLRDRRGILRMNPKWLEQEKAKRRARDARRVETKELEKRLTAVFEQMGHAALQYVCALSKRDRAWLATALRGFAAIVERGKPYE